MINMIVDNLHVRTSNMGVIRAIWSRLLPESRMRGHRQLRHTVMRQALKRHASNRETYRAVMSGDL